MNIKRILLNIPLGGILPLSWQMKMITAVTLNETKFKQVKTQGKAIPHLQH